MKKNTSFIVRACALLCCFMLALCLLPRSAAALTFNGMEFDADYSGKLTNGVDGNVIGAITPNAGTITKKGGDGEDTLVLQLNLADGWYFVGWETWYVGPSDEGSNFGFRHDDKHYFSPEGIPTTTVQSSPVYRRASTIQINKDYWTGGGVLGCTFYVYAVCEPRISISANTDVSYWLNNGTDEITLDSYLHRVPFNGGLTIKTELQRDTDMITGFSVRGTSAYDPKDYLTGSVPQLSFQNIRGPLWITVNTASHEHTGGTATCQSVPICTVCGNPYGAKDADNHVGGTELRGAFEPTGGGAGYTGDTVCLGCEKILEFGEPIYPAHEHTGGTATCREQAVCGYCGESYGARDTSNHVGGTTIVNAKPAEEFAAGYTGDTVCLGCGTTIAYGTELPMLHRHSHSSDWSFDKSEHWHACICGDKADKADHSFGDWQVITAPTTETEGEKQRTCRCGYVDTEKMDRLDPEDIPETGDGAALYLAAGLAALSLAGAVLCGKRRGRRA